MIVIFGFVMQKSNYLQIKQEFYKQVICFAFCCFSLKFLQFQQIFNRNICAFSFEASLNLCDWQKYRLIHFKDRSLICKFQELSLYFYRSLPQLLSISYLDHFAISTFCSYDYRFL